MNADVIFNNAFEYDINTGEASPTKYHTEENA